MLIRPTKHSHPDQTIIFLSTIIIKKLKQKTVVHFTDLLRLAKAKVIGGEVLFLPTLNFIYMMGVIEYRQKTDSIEYVGPK